MNVVEKKKWTEKRPREIKTNVQPNLSVCLYFLQRREQRLCSAEAAGWLRTRRQDRPLLRPIMRQYVSYHLYLLSLETVCWRWDRRDQTRHYIVTHSHHLWISGVRGWRWGVELVTDRSVTHWDSHLNRNSPHPQVLTKVKKKIKPGGWGFAICWWFLGCFGFFGWFASCLVCCLPGFKKFTHFCPVCGSVVNTLSGFSF